MNKNLFLILITSILIFSGCGKDFKNTNEMKNLAVELVLMQAKLPYIIDNSVGYYNYATYKEKEANENSLVYVLKVPVCLEQKGLMYCVFLNQKIMLSKTEPKMKYTQNITYGQNNKQIWVGYFDGIKDEKRKMDYDFNAKRLTKEINNDGTYPLERGQFKILKKTPFHIQISDTYLTSNGLKSNSIHGITISSNKSAIVYATIITFIKTSYNSVKVTGIPLMINTKSIPLKTVGYLPEYQDTIVIKRNILLDYLKKNIGIKLYTDLVTDKTNEGLGLVMNKKFKQMIYDDQGGLTLNVLYKFLKSQK